MDTDGVGFLRRCTIPISTVEGDWAKLHPEAMALVKGSEDYQAFDIATEGWILTSTRPIKSQWHNGAPQAIWVEDPGPMKGSVYKRV